MPFTRLHIFLLTIIFYSISIKSEAESISLNGIWQSKKLQFFIEIKENIFSRYQYTNLSCFKGSAGFLPAAGYVSKSKFNNYFPYSISNNQLFIKRPQENLFLTLTKIEKLPYACKGEPVDTILSNFYIFWQTINELYSFSHISKDAWADIFKKQLPSLIDLDMRLFDSREEEDIFLLSKLEEILYTVTDPHLLLIAPSVQKTILADSSKNKFNDIYYNRKLLDKWLKKQLLNIRGEAVWFANKNILVIESGKTLYINIIKLNDLGDSSRYDLSSIKNIKSVEDYLLTKLSHQSKVIVDLRFNDGGSIDVANKLSSIFTEVEQPVTYIEVEDSTQLRLLSMNKGTGIKPSCLTILTSSFTASAAEYLTLNLLQAQGKSIGEKTRGAFSPMILKSLPNDWILGVPPFKTYDEFDNPLPENKGIAPSISKNWILEQQQYEPINLHEYTKHCET